MKIHYKNINNSSFIVVSFYTLDHIYSNEIKRLISSLEKFNLGYYIEGIPPLGDWRTCTNYKAKFIKRALDRLDTQALVFIDADGEIVKYPYIFDSLKCDIAAFVNHINNLLSGTLYFSNNNNAKNLIDKWIEAIDNSKSMIFEQKILQNAICKSKDIKFIKLPISYCQIYDYKVQSKDPVIIHWQISRKSKKIFKQLHKEEVNKIIKEIDLYACNINL